jgi:hypothetical protein
MNPRAEPNEAVGLLRPPRTCAFVTSAIEVGFHTRPLALATEYQEEPVVPFFCEVTEQTLPRTREVFGLNSPVLRVDETGLEAPALERLAQ